MWFITVWLSWNMMFVIITVTVCLIVKIFVNETLSRWDKHQKNFKIRLHIYVKCNGELFNLHYTCTRYIDLQSDKARSSSIQHNSKDQIIIRWSTFHFKSHIQRVLPSMYRVKNFFSRFCWSLLWPTIHKLGEGSFYYLQGWKITSLLVGQGNFLP